MAITYEVLFSTGDTGSSSGTFTLIGMDFELNLAAVTFRQPEVIDCISITGQ
jgi:hypothetical protein